MKIPPNREKTAVLNHKGTTGSSAVITAHGIPANIEVKSPKINNIEPI
jgi:hypothetical protein